MQRADAGVSTGQRPRLLPWTTDDGKKCLLRTDDESGFLSRLADDFEAVQLAMGADMVTEASKVLGNPLATHAEVSYLALRLSESLSGVLQIAESRGLRLPAPEVSDEGDEGSGEAVG
ncbi:hypothetical protein [Streptomyces lincolnensis]|uniref:hypothetical protein n=1 Tax=Streptomyces lincolnensis TaxID=1915 RepID=UPI0037D3F96B